MNLKDKLNKISGVIAISALLIIVVGIVTENQTMLGFPNAMMLYLLLPSALIWFGTRKNGCGSCNQTCAIPEHEKNNEDVQPTKEKF